MLFYSFINQIMLHRLTFNHNQDLYSIFVRFFSSSFTIFERFFLRFTIFERFFRVLLFLSASFHVSMQKI